jgi:hypothetical protein
LDPLIKSQLFSFPGFVVRDCSRGCSIPVAQRETLIKPTGVSDPLRREVITEQQMDYIPYPVAETPAAAG